MNAESDEGGSRLPSRPRPSFAPSVQPRSGCRRYRLSDVAAGHSSYLDALLSTQLGLGVALTRTGCSSSIIGMSSTFAPLFLVALMEPGRETPSTLGSRPQS